MIEGFTSITTNCLTISLFGIDDNTHTPLLILPRWPFLLINVSLSLSSFDINCKGYLSLRMLPLYSCISSLLIEKCHSPWSYTFYEQCFSVFKHLTISLLIFLFLSLWHHVKKDNSPYLYVSPCLYDTYISLLIIFLPLNSLQDDV